MTQDEENQLVREAQENVESFETLYDYYFPKVYGFVMGKLGNQGVAEDLVSEIFLKVLDALPRYKFRGLPFGAWVFRIAHNHLKDYYASSKRKQMDKLEDVSWIESKDETLNPERAAKQENLRQSLVDSFNILNELEEEIVRMKYFSDLKNQEIANTLGMSETHVAVTLHRALKKLKAEHA